MLFPPGHCVVGSITLLTKPSIIAQATFPAYIDDKGRNLIAELFFIREHEIFFTSKHIISIDK